MTIANQITELEYVGNGVDTTFSIPFAYIEVNVIKIYLEGVLQIETADYVLDNPLAPINIDMVLPPANGSKLLVKRESPLIQPTDLLNNSPGHEEVVEDQLDRLTMAIQEVNSKAESATSSSSTIETLALINDWAPAIYYVKNQVVVTNSLMYRAISDHNSSAGFNIDLVGGKWELLETSGIEGVQGIQGLQGATGPQGVPGNDGMVGIDGVDGFFTSEANQAQAEAGILSGPSSGMSSLRVAQAITAQIGNSLEVLANETNIAANGIVIADLTTRVIALEAQVQLSIGKFIGSQPLLNNQAVDIDILGSLTSGKGAPLNRDGDGTEFAQVMIYVHRKTDTETRFSSFDLVFQYVDDVWYIARKETMQLEETLDLDGVILTVTTNAISKVGQVSYKSDLMAGANHDTQSFIKYLGQEIPKGI